MINLWELNIPINVNNSIIKFPMTHQPEDSCSSEISTNYSSVPVTFVTAYIDLLEDRSTEQSPEVRFNQFKRLARTGIKICLFTSSVYQSEASELCKDYPNVYLMPSIELTDTQTYLKTSSLQLSLPDQRKPSKDTYNYMVLINSKIEFTCTVMDINPFKSTHFAWIDFSIGHVISSDDTFSRLININDSLKERMLVLPGCWSKELSHDQIENVWNVVNWRFCGGFFLGDKDSIIDFYDYYQQHYLRFLEQTGKYHGRLTSGLGWKIRPIGPPNFIRLIITIVCYIYLKMIYNLSDNRIN